VDQALFIPDGDGYHPSELTRGGWSDDAQHGGPPLGLLAHVIESRFGRYEMMVVRLTTDLIRPVPLTLLDAESRLVRPGRRVQVIEAILRAGELEVALTRALMIRLTDIDLPEAPELGWVQPGPPETFEPIDVRLWTGDQASLIRFHHDAVEMRTLDASFYTPGAGTSWFRLLYPVVAGAPTSAFVRTATLADLGNGNSTAIDPRRWIYVNPDVAIALHRALDGEWLGMRSAAHQHATGVGMAESLIFDAHGPIGVVTQSQLIQRR
jgi:hypothetical protein